jgi:RimJ/RimL family protein N-acetyltransferase
MKHDIILREIKQSDKAAFVAAMQQSQSFHHPWVKAPSTPEEFDQYFERCQQDRHKGFVVCDANHNIAGVFNLNEIVRGLFQNAYLGFYAVAHYAGQGYMSVGLKKLFKHFFNELGLHRIEANIQPTNTQSIHLVKSNGFRYEGSSPHYLKIDGVWQEHEHWAMTKEDYR